MSSIYDDDKNMEILANGKQNSKPEEVLEPELEERPAEEQLPIQPVPQQLPVESPQQAHAHQMELESYQVQSEQALNLVDDIVMKHYLTKLKDLDVIPLSLEEDDENIRIFKINKMVYEKDEYATDKFISVVSAMTYCNASVFLIVDGHKNHTDFYLGIKNSKDDEERSASSVADALRDSLRGQFPGIELQDFSIQGINATAKPHDELLKGRIQKAISVSSCVGIPSYKNSKGEYTNDNFIQGIEKFAAAMQGKDYTAIILASNTMPEEIAAIRTGYESIYSEISAMATKQLAYSTNESLSNAYSRTKGISNTLTHTHTEGVSEAHTEGKSHTEGTTKTHTETKGESKENFWAKAGKLAGPLLEAGAFLGGAALTATGVGAPIGLSLMAGGAAVAGGAAGIGSFFGAKTKNKSTSDSLAKNESDTTNTSDTHTTNTSDSEAKGRTESFNEQNGTTSQVGASKNFTITLQDKHIQEVQKRIEKQLERLEICESTGLWSTGAYFLSYGQDRATAEVGAAIFRSIMQGEQSGVEFSAVNSWQNNEDQFADIIRSVGTLTHPTFKYNSPVLMSETQLLATSMLSSKEVAMLIGLPRKSVPGFPVVEHVSLGREVVLTSGASANNGIELGCIVDQGMPYEGNKVFIDTKSLTQHTLITGSTGCGKSNTVYYLLDQIKKNNPDLKFLIVEPAKGEYKDVFGDIAYVYGTNPKVTDLLRINPFRFPEGVHVLEHIDRLIEIFNVCWPMYAAMPAVLKEAILNAYEDCGWDLYTSVNKYSNEMFPTFADLQNSLVMVISNSAYSEEVKSNYQGSLVTRVKSLNNGICKQIFCHNELGDKVLFDSNVIIDLSRIGSQETKSLIMGILVMRLSEYRANSDIKHNSPLRHITVLEEAHNILKRTSQEQSMESANVAGKSVEMISNAIAEMRTYGEGFVIVDQSPGAVDISAIRNTNTKIIMRLPETTDRKVAGKASAMKDNQLDEIAKLATGVAVVYQNNWEEPVLCKIGKYEGKEKSFDYKPDNNHQSDDGPTLVLETLKLLLMGRTQTEISPAPNVDYIISKLSDSPMATVTKIAIFRAIKEYKQSNNLKLWSDNHFVELAWLVTEILGLRSDVAKEAERQTSFESLTEKLFEMINSAVKGLPESLLLPASHCLMRDYATQKGDTQKRVFSAWYKSIKNRVL